MDEIRIREQVDLIREVFSYQSRFDGKTIVIKIDYPVLELPAFPSLVKDLAMLRQTGINIVVVPGAKERIDEVLSRYKLESRTVDGVRISESEAIPFIKMAAFDAANRFMTLFSAHKTNAIIGNFVRARAMGVIHGIDYEQSGKVDRINVEALSQLMNMGQVPVLPCIGWSNAGKPYNLNSDELALATAESLKAVKLFFICPAADINSSRFTLSDDMDRATDGRLIRLRVEQAHAFIGMNLGRANPELQKVAYATKACELGVERAHIVDGSVEGVILKELFSALGIGTMVYNSPADDFRPLSERDISEVLNLMQPLVDLGILKPRSADEIRERMPDYVVCDSDGIIRACGALHVFAEEHCAEIAAIAVAPAFSQLGLGGRLIEFLSQRARSLQLKRVFVLTTQSQDWFESLGFYEGRIADLPASKREHYDYGRKSEVYLRDLGAHG